MEKRKTWMHLVIFGWGNVSRGDDGLGPLLLARIAEAGWENATLIEDFQLQIEHALDLQGADLALFIDAGKDTPAPFSFREIFPQDGMTHTTHALPPELCAGGLSQGDRKNAAARLPALRARRKL